MANNFKGGRIILGTEFAGYKYGLFETGTSTAKTTYKDSNLTVGNENTHPVVLDANGAAQIWFLGDADATFYTSADAVVYTDNSVIGSDISSVSRNAIINGDFSVWQRGTSFAAIADATYSADRWTYNKVGAAVHTVSRSTDVPTVAQAGRLHNYSILIDCTTVDSSIAAGDYVILNQRIEGYNWLPLAQRTITLSFWVKATKTGTYCVSLKNSGSDRSYVAEYTVSTTATWEYKTVVITASPSAGTWDYTTGIGSYVIFCLSSGSTFHTTAGAWQTGNFFATSGQVNATDSTSNDFRLCGVQLEAGGVATSFEQRTVQQELFLCQRYFSKSYNYANVPGTAITTSGEHDVWIALSADEALGSKIFPCPMRTVPTVTIYNLAGTAGGAHVAGGAGDITVVTVDRISEYAPSRLSKTAGWATGNVIAAAWKAEAEL